MGKFGPYNLRLATPIKWILSVAILTGCRQSVPQLSCNQKLQFSKYRIAGNFRWVLIFAISRTVYGVAKIKTAIIYFNRNSKVGSFEIAKIKISKIISHTFTFKSQKFSSAKISRYTVF